VTTGFVWHELYAWHDTGTGAWVIPAGLTVQPLGHLENSEGKRRIRNLIEVSGLIDHLVMLKPRAATEEEILGLHTSEYVDRIRRESSQLGGDAGELTPFGPGSYDIAFWRSADASPRSTPCSTGRLTTRTRSCGRLDTTPSETRVAGSASSAMSP